MVSFYSTIIPIGIAWGIGTLLVQYWVDKYNLIRRRTIKYNMSKDLSREMTELLEYALIIYCVSILIFRYIITNDTSTSTTPLIIIGIAIGILHAMLPMDLVNRLIFKVKLAPPN